MIKNDINFLSSTSAEGILEQYLYVLVDEAKEDDITQYIYDLNNNKYK